VLLWLAYNLDGSLHEWRESTNKKDIKFSRDLAQPQTSTLKLTLTLESLDQRIKNIEESFDMRIKKIEAVLFRD
jgi:hypothetical protein